MEHSTIYKAPKKISRHSPELLLSSFGAPNFLCAPRKLPTLTWRAPKELQTCILAYWIIFFSTTCLFYPFFAQWHVIFNPMVFNNRTLWIGFGKSSLVKLEFSTSSNTGRIIICQTIFGTNWRNFQHIYIGAATILIKWLHDWQIHRWATNLSNG